MILIEMTHQRRQRLVANHQRGRSRLRQKMSFKSERKSGETEGFSVERFALLKDATTLSSDEECVFKHGAKQPKRRRSEGCTTRVVKGGVCVKPGAKVKPCSSGGCTNQVRHGATCSRKKCRSEGCTNIVIK